MTSNPSACSLRVNASKCGQTLFLPLCRPVAVGAISTNLPARMLAFFNASYAWLSYSGHICSHKLFLGLLLAGLVFHSLKACAVKKNHDSTACKLELGFCIGHLSKRLRPSSR